MIKKLYEGQLQLEDKTDELANTVNKKIEKLTDTVNTKVCILNLRWEFKILYRSKPENEERQRIGPDIHTSRPVPRQRERRRRLGKELKDRQTDGKWPW